MSSASEKLPNAMTVAELVNSGVTHEQASLIMHKRVFGENVQFDKTGKPIEIGIGSEANPFKGTHNSALAMHLQKQATVNPNNADIIKAAVEAGVKAGLASAAMKKGKKSEEEDL